jgi:hypothetical protein
MRAMYERRGHPVVPFRHFLRRFVRHLGLVGALVCGSLALGMAGYHYLGGMSWVDGFLNSAMLIGGMGPTTPVVGNAAKLFSGMYALYCGLVFMVSMTILMVPVVHRVLHRFHADA